MTSIGYVCGFLALSPRARSSPAHSFIRRDRDVCEGSGVKPAGDLFLGDEPSLRCIELVEDIEKIPFVRELSPITKVFVEWKERQR